MTVAQTIAVSRDSLLRGLRIAAAVARKPKLGDSLSFHNVAIRASDRGIMLEAFGRDACLSTTIEATPQRPGGFACNARLLAKTVALLPQPTVELSDVAGKSAYIRVASGERNGASYAATLPIGALDDFPVFMPSCAEMPTATATLASADLKEALRRIDGFRAECGTGRPVLEDFHLVANAEGQVLDCYGSDGYAMGHAQSPISCAGATLPYLTLAASALRLLALVPHPTTTIDVLPSWFRLTIGATRAWFRDDKAAVRMNKLYAEYCRDWVWFEVDRATLNRALVLADRMTRYNLGSSFNTYGANYGVNLHLHADTMLITTVSGRDDPDGATATIPATRKAGATFATPLVVGVDQNLLLRALEACAPSLRVAIGFTDQSNPISVVPCQEGIGFSALVMPMHRHGY